MYAMTYHGAVYMCVQLLSWCEEGTKGKRYLVGGEQANPHTENISAVTIECGGIDDKGRCRPGETGAA